ncbi:MAG: hydrogenase maturation protease [Clostridia bacterium]|nr:hydrogenase maturation protease [Clostridia bacterium]
MKIIVLGIGNRLLMDDGIGVYVVDELKKRDSTSVITYVIGETDIDYCLDETEDADYLFIIDAAQSGNPPGHIMVFKLEEIVTMNDIGLTMHNLHLFDMLVYSKNRLKGLIIGIEPYMIDYCLGLSIVLTTKLKEITGHVKDIISRSLQEYTY